MARGPSDDAEFDEFNQWATWVSEYDGAGWSGDDAVAAYTPDFCAGLSAVTVDNPAQK
jgi:hypothetical protein